MKKQAYSNRITLSMSGMYITEFEPRPSALKTVNLITIHEYKIIFKAPQASLLQWPDFTLFRNCIGFVECVLFVFLKIGSPCVAQADL